MKIIMVVLSLIVLSGCESIAVRTDNARFYYGRIFIDQKIESATYERGDIKVSINEKTDKINSESIVATGGAIGEIVGQAVKTAATI